MRTGVGAMCGVVVLVTCASFAWAEDLEDVSFSLRLAAAQSRFSRFTGAAGLLKCGSRLCLLLWVVYHWPQKVALSR